jgi:hypothetical protein
MLVGASELEDGAFATFSRPRFQERMGTAIAFNSLASLMERTEAMETKKVPAWLSGLLVGGGLPGARVA